ncbi:MAG: fibrobacter succinogenes major paralogous domain-containing protein [Bacteroidetes bacterium]|nr:fibrobacter succinogenes major paralogous domain-containing protein [Bacteroidota bacterium]
MKHILTIICCFAVLSMSAQTDYPFPWNPDADLDGWVSTEDLLQLLTVFGTQFEPDTWETDSISAAVVLEGNHNYFQCQSYCNDIEGNWRMADLDAFGRHFDLASSVSAYFWVNGNDKLNSSDFAYDTYQLYGPTGDMANVSVSNFSQAKKCMCYILANPALEFSLYDECGVLHGPGAIYECGCSERPEGDCDCNGNEIDATGECGGACLVDEDGDGVCDDVDPCIGQLDECNICNGPGAIYECGCTEIPVSNCDCDGNQFDAIGVCGGDCLEDADGDGECDLYPAGPCEYEETLTYHDEQYAIIEIGDQCWFAENLRTSQYSDGSNIITGSFDLWEDNFLVSAVCQPHPTQVSLTGYYYNWVAANYGLLVEGKNVCPVGWHVPTVEDFTQLESYLGSNSGGKLRMVDNGGWKSPNWQATNETGFSSPACGYMRYVSLMYDTSLRTRYLLQVEGGLSWPPSSIPVAHLTYNNSEIQISTISASEEAGHSIRCIKD